MVMTMLEAQVQAQNVARLKSAYEAALRELEPGIVETFLASDVRNPTVWRIMTVWKDRQALDAMRSTGQTPRGVLIFREASAEPSLSILEVAAHATV